MKIFNVFILLACVIYSCKTEESKRDFSVQPFSVKDEVVYDLKLDTLLLDSVPTSFVIESDIHAGKIFLLDKLFCTLYQFDSLGQFQRRYLGQGRAKNETTIGRIATHAFVGEELFLLDHSGGYHSYDKEFFFKDYFRLIYSTNWNSNKIYQSPMAYTQRYNDIVCRAFQGCVFFNVHLAHPRYNFVTTMKTHLENNANIQEINLKKENFGRLLAIGYPESYESDSDRKAVFSSVNFDIDRMGNFYLTYEADTLIYVYDKEFCMKQCFGFSGRDMDLNYVSTLTPQEVGQNYRKERNTKGFYNWMEYVDETNVLFRSYKKGKERSSDGLQIYQKGILIGDVDVPKGLKVMGFINPYYYSYIISDEEREKLYLYRFRL